MTQGGAIDPFEISVAHVRVPFHRPFVTAAGRWTVRESWIVRLRGDGTAGYGEVALDPAAGRVELATIDRAVRELVLASQGRADWDVQMATRPAAVRAGLNAALLGVGAISLDREMAPSVAVNATIDGDETGEVVGRARSAVDAGFETLKLKGGKERSPGELVERIRAVRDAVGPSVHLRLDVNGSWDVATARVTLEALQGFGLEYVEQPIAGRAEGAELADVASLRRATTVPIALDESVTDDAAARAIVEAGAADVLVVKPARVGGIEAVVRIGDLAAGHGVGTVVSNLLETGVGLAAGITAAAMLGPNVTHGLATADVLVSDLLSEPIRVESGRVALPTLTGLRVDDDAVRRFSVEACGAAW